MTRALARDLRRALALLATTAVLVPTGTAVAPTATPTPTPSATATPTPTATATPTPTQPAAPGIEVDRQVITSGETHRLAVFARAGTSAELFAATLPNTAPRLIRQDDVAADGRVVWELRPGGTTRFHAVVDGVRSATVTVQVRRSATIGIRQASGTYTFSGVVGRPQAGVQVTIARLDGSTGRVTGIASTRTTADGRYEIRTSLPVGFAGYYALTSQTVDLLAGRSRLYGLIVNTRPAAQADSLSLGATRSGGRYVFAGRLTPGRSVPVTLARLVEGRYVGLVGGRTSADGSYRFTLALPSGTHFFQAVTATARSRGYGVVVPAAPVRQPPTTIARPADVDCEDFATQAEAQAFHDRWFARFGDFARLDGDDDDGRACESLP